MDFEKIAKGEISIERFFGQTVIYLPTDIGDKVSKESVESILGEYFTKERVKLLPRLSQSQRAVGLYASGIKSIILN